METASRQILRHVERAAVLLIRIAYCCGSSMLGVARIGKVALGSTMVGDDGRVLPAYTPQYLAWPAD
jgi:hypothetical protein